MEMTLAEYQRKVAYILDNREAISVEIINEMKPQLEDAQREQLWHGYDANGNDIQPSYAPLTIELKKLSGQPTDRVTLKDTGDFYDSIFANVEGKDIVFGATDWKTIELTEKYGNDIFGLNQDSEMMMRDEWTKRFKVKLAELL